MSESNTKLLILSRDLRMSDKSYLRNLFGLYGVCSVDLKRIKKTQLLSNTAEITGASQGEPNQPSWHKSSLKQDSKDEEIVACVDFVHPEAARKAQCALNGNRFRSGLWWIQFGEIFESPSCVVTKRIVSHESESPVKRSRVGEDQIVNHWET